MSRDLTPKELRFFINRHNLPNIVESLQVTVGDNTASFYTEEQKDLSRMFPLLGKFGFDFLLCCKEIGVFSNENGKHLIQEIENYFNGDKIEDKELENATNMWYEGNFSPGYSMNHNNEDFALFIKTRIA